MKGACDTHMHFYDGRYPVAPAAKLRPGDATVGDYRAVQRDLGLDRVVVVQPTTYGLDNRCQLDAAAAFGDSARAVAVVDASTDAQALRGLSDRGVVGARFHMLAGGAVSWEALGPVAERVGEYGWHIQLQLNGHELVERLELLGSLPCGLVIDHVGRFMPPVDPESAAFGALVSLVDAGAFVKLSAPYESAPDPTHRYELVSAGVAALVDRAPDRLLWATNWPHPGQADPPDVATLVKLRDRWLPTERLQRQVLVDNPARLYGF